jgi:hypothetical protein
MKLAVIAVVFICAVPYRAASQERSVVPITMVRDKTLVTVTVGDILIPKNHLDTGFS